MKTEKRGRKRIYQKGGVHLNIYVEVDLAYELYNLSEATGNSISSIVNEAIKNELKKDGNK